MASPNPNRREARVPSKDFDQAQEELIADARGSRTFSQLVEQKLVALLRGGPGHFREEAGRPEDVRRIPRGPQVAALPSSPLARPKDPSCETP